MDKKFLHKVVDQLVYETRIDYDEKKVYISPPFIRDPSSPSHILYTSYLFFYHHCKDVYGLNEQEIEYIWDEYRRIIKDKIKNG